MTQKQLKEYYNYDENTGILIWKKKTCSKSKAIVGTEAGSVNSHGYKQVRFDGKMYKVHRLAFLYMTGSFPTNHVDHINHNRKDNKWNNLREVTILENSKNRKISRNNTSGENGISILKSGKYRVRIKVKNKEINLGCFINKVDAIEARKLAEVKYGFHVNHGK